MKNLNHHNYRGFALIISLSLMAMIFLIIVALSSMATVEKKTQYMRKTEAMARKNALAGLKIAMGQLQKYAGPDQRVTARADILEEHSGNLDFDTGSVKNSFYTLVWDVSGNENNEALFSNRYECKPKHNTMLKPAVLVSGNDSLDFNLGKAVGYPPRYINASTDLKHDPDAVYIVGALAGSSEAPAPSKMNETDEDGRSLKVIVKKEALGDDGNYAWWVSDDGIKSRMNIEPSKEQEEEYTWMTLQRHGPPAVEGLEGLDADLLSRAFSVQSLNLATGGSRIRDGIINQATHFASFHTKGVLADVVRGRLKQDLSYGLDSANSAPAGLADGDFVFDDSKGGPYYMADIHYARWGVLRDFYNLYKEEQTQSGVIDARAHMKGGFGDLKGDEGFKMGILPVVTRFQYGWYVGDSGSGQAEIYHQPAIALWNPYNIDLECDEMKIRFTNKGKFNFGGVSDGAFHLMFDEDRQKIHDIKDVSFSIEPLTIPAGESIIFSPSGKEDFEKNNNILVSGWRSGSCFKELSKNSRQGGKPIDIGNTLTFKMSDKKGRPTGDQYEIAVMVSFVNNPAVNGHRRVAAIRRLSGQPAGNGSAVPPYTPNGGFAEPVFLYVYSMNFSDIGFDFTHDTIRPIQWLGNFNPRAILHNKQSVDALTDIDKRYPPAYLGGYAIDSDDVYEPQLEGTENTLVGGSAVNGAVSGQLFDIPRKPLQTLAQLGHAHITAVDNDHGKKNENQETYHTHMNHHRSGGNFAPAYAIGSALASPYIPLDEVFVVWPDKGNAVRLKNKSMMWDYSYLLNRELFDRYFFSTVSQEEAVDLTKPFPNGLYEPYKSSTKEADLKHFDKAAANLMVNGAFNINSTSVQAWTSFLGAFRGVAVQGSSEEQLTPYVRLEREEMHPLDEDDIEVDNGEMVTAYRAVTDADLQDLAGRIVEQVKLRGPFPSMSAFVNRVVYTDTLYQQAGLDSAVEDPHGLYSGLDAKEMVSLKGALEMALEYADVNQLLFEDSGVKYDEDPVSAPNAFSGSLAAHTPGYLSQIDILSRLGSAMTNRSDTFTIRAYGDVMSNAGNIVNKARCEAVVQRYPEFFHSENEKGNKAEDPKESLVKINKEFGRKFRVVSMRWLGKDDV